MRTRTLFTGLLGLSAMVGADAVALPVAASEPVNWDASLWGTRRGFTEGVEYLSKELDARTNGNFTLTLHYGGAISPARENIDGISIGAFEVATTCVSYHPAKTPAMTVLDLPFLPLPTFDVHREVHETVYQHPAIVEEMERWNARAIFSNLLQQYQFLGVGDPPRQLEDWEGMRVRAPGGVGQAMRQLGAIPTTVPAPEVYTSLERGVVQAAAFPFTTAHGAFRLHEAADWFTSNLNPGAINCPLLVNIGALEGLPTEYRELIFDLKPGMYEAMRTAYQEGDDRWLPIFRERMEEIVYDDEQIENLWDRAAQPIWDEWVEQHAEQIPAQELLDLVFEAAEAAGAS